MNYHNVTGPFHLRKQMVYCWTRKHITRTLSLYTMRGSKGGLRGPDPLQIQISLNIHYKITKYMYRTPWQTQITVGPPP